MNKQLHKRLKENEIFRFMIFCSWRKYEGWPDWHLSFSGFSASFLSIVPRLLLKRNDNILQVIIVSSSGWCTYNNPIKVWNLSHSPESFPVTLQLPSHTPHHLFPTSSLKCLSHYFRTLLNFCQLSEKHGWHIGLSWTYFLTWGLLISATHYNHICHALRCYTLK